MNFLGKQNKERPLFVAEIGAKFESIADCMSTIDYAKEAGADFAKIQFYAADELVPKNGYKWKSKDLYEMYQQSEFPEEWLKDVFQYGEARGIPVFSSVYSPKGYDKLDKAGCKAFKVSSFENEYNELLELLDHSDTPYIVSAGMLSDERLAEISMEISPNLWMHCVSAYPCKFEDYNLKRITYINDHCGPCGLSDHSKTGFAAMIATVLGAPMIERHFSLDPKEPYEDDPTTLRYTIAACKMAQSSMQDQKVHELTEIKEQRMIGKERI